MLFFLVTARKDVNALIVFTWYILPILNQFVNALNLFCIYLFYKMGKFVNALFVNKLSTKLHVCFTLFG